MPNFAALFHNTAKLGGASAIGASSIALDKSLTLGNLKASFHYPRLIAIFGLHELCSTKPIKYETNET